MSGGVAASGTADVRTAQLERAYDTVAEVLEHVDLGEEPDLAEEVIAALAALDRAREMSEGER